MAKKMDHPSIKVDKWITEEGLKKIENWARRGLSYKEIAQNIGVTPKTLGDWRLREHPEIEEAIVRGRESDWVVENALYLRAKGYDYYDEQQEWDEVEEKFITIKRTKKHLPGDLGAQIFFLKNRLPKFWRDKILDKTDEEFLEAISGMMVNVRRAAKKYESDRDE